MDRENNPPGQSKLELRRYPNRRYYDSTRSQHLTLEGIYRLVREGCDVTVCDSKTGEDITAKVLAQLILDHDPPKLAAFPAELLHQIIRSNESLLREFVEKYFSRALAAFLKSQREFDRYLGQALGLYGMAPVGRGWAEMMMGPFARAFLGPGEEETPPEQAPSRSGGTGVSPVLRQGTGETPVPHDERPDSPELWKTVEELQRQVADLRKQLDQR